MSYFYPRREGDVGSRPDQLPQPPRFVLVIPYQLLARKNPRRHEGSLPVSKSGLTPGAEDVLEWDGIMGMEVGEGGGQTGDVPRHPQF